MINSYSRIVPYYLICLLLLLCSSSTVAAATSIINLQSANLFTILAKTGITNVSPMTESIINGNIGLDQADTSNIRGLGVVFPGQAMSNSIINGDILAGIDTLSASIDITNAYQNAMNQIQSNEIIDYQNGRIGNSEILIPGVYHFNGDLSISTSETLSLHGHCGDVFIFRSTSSISIGAYSQILLTGGITPSSIYFIAGTSITIGSGAIFNGIILAGTSVFVSGTIVGRIYAEQDILINTASITPPSAGSNDLDSMCSVISKPVELLAIKMIKELTPFEKKIQIWGNSFMDFFGYDQI